MTNFFLPEGYQSREEPRYEHDVQDGGVIYQPDVYADALARLLAEGGRRLVVDVGCGRAQKLIAMGEEVKTVGVDYGPNVDYLRARWPDRMWWNVDLEQGFNLLLKLEGATVICADVVEHLRDPSALLTVLASWQPVVREIVLSTPERDLHYGKAHLGPPRNRCHVREWNSREFESLLRSFGLNPTMGLSRTSTRGPERETIEAICRK